LVILFEFCFNWILGSADAGQTVHDKNKYFSQLMKRAAKHINVKGHVCGNQKVMIYGPTDIEGIIIIIILLDEEWRLVV
jgi:hypothetical protein